MSKTDSATEYDVLAVLGAIMALKLLFLMLDGNLRFILGDSAVYLNSAFANLPTDRSWTYGALFIKALLNFGSVQAVIYAQAALSGLSCYLLYRILRRQVGLAGRWASALSLLACIEPLSLVYERFLLTDSLAWSLMTLLISLTISMLRRPEENGVGRAIAFALLFVAIASLRGAYMPVLGFLVIFVVCFLMYRYRTTKQFVFLSALTVTLISFNAVYFSETKRLTGNASYNSSDGFFLLASWAPNIEKVDLDRHIDGSTVIDTLGFTLNDVRNRPGHLFLPDGLISRLRQHLGDDQLANVVARKAALHSLERNPWGIVTLAWQTYSGYWDTGYMLDRLRHESGILPLDANLVELVRDRFHESLAENHLQASLFRSILLHVRVWDAAIPFITILLALSGLWCRTASASMVAATAVIILFAALGLATEPVPRYLIGLPWLNLLLTGMLAGTIRPALVQDIGCS